MKQDVREHSLRTPAERRSHTRIPKGGWKQDPVLVRKEELLAHEQWHNGAILDVRRIRRWEANKSKYIQESHTKENMKRNERITSPILCYFQLTTTTLPGARSPSFRHSPSNAMLKIFKTLNSTLWINQNNQTYSPKFSIWSKCQAFPTVPLSPTAPTGSISPQFEPP